MDSNKVWRLRYALNNDTEFKLAVRFMSEDVLLESDAGYYDVPAE